RWRHGTAARGKAGRTAPAVPRGASRGGFPKAWGRFSDCGRRPKPGSLEIRPDPVNPNTMEMVYGSLRRLLHALSLALLPPRCLVCGEAGSGGLDLCAACRDALPVPTAACRRCALPLAGAGVCGPCGRRPPPLDALRAPVRCAVPVDRLLPRHKFRRDLAAGRLLATLMAAALAGAERPQALVPVPLHRA